MNKEKIRQLLERFGRALSADDLKGVADCWEFPALVFFDEDGAAVGNTGDVERLFRQAIEAYSKQGVTSTKPELEGVEALNAKLVAVDVRWPALDSSGKEKFSERSHYILRLGGDGQFHLRVALTRTT